MKKNKTNTKQLEMRLIRRKQVQQGLVVTTVLALLLSGCISKKATTPYTNPTTVTDQNSNEKVDAVFYENVGQCQMDALKQQEEYAVLLKAYEKKELANKPTEPVIKAENCEAQLQAARQEHEKNAPVYSSLADCQAEGVNCEATPTQSNALTATSYRPIFGGSYFYPYGGYGFTYINLGGIRHRVYEPRPVYQSSSPGQVVTPYGRTVSKTNPGHVSVPRHTTVAAPQRPPGTAARGTIKGRSSKGFGSTYKSTGRGGK